MNALGAFPEWASDPAAPPGLFLARAAWPWPAEQTRLEVDAIARHAPFRTPLTPKGNPMRLASTSCGPWGLIGAGGPYRYESCDPRTRQIRLGRPASVAGTVTIRTSSTTRSLSAHAVASGAELSLPVADPLLDAMAFSRGRFTIEQSGQVPLVIPAYAEIGRVIEDCRG